MIFQKIIKNNKNGDLNNLTIQKLSLAVEKIIDEEFKEIQKLDIPERVKSLCYVYKQQLKQKLTEMEI